MGARPNPDFAGLYADRKAPSELAVELGAPCFGFVDASRRAPIRTPRLLNA